MTTVGSWFEERLFFLPPPARIFVTCRVQELLMQSDWWVGRRSSTYEGVAFTWTGCDRGVSRVSYGFQGL